MNGRWTVRSFRPMRVPPGVLRAGNFLDLLYGRERQAGACREDLVAACQPFGRRFGGGCGALPSVLVDQNKSISVVENPHVTAVNGSAKVLKSDMSSSSNPTSGRFWLDLSGCPTSLRTVRFG